MEAERRDHLISRVVDRCESAADWDALAELESERGEVWRELAQALRCEAELRSVMATELERADRVALPKTSTPPQRFALPTWSGWVAAAACLALWFASTRSEPEQPPVAPALAAVERDDAEFVAENAPEETEDDAAVITELPMVVVETKPAANGDGYEVVYLRRVLESRTVDQVLELAPDESGGLRPVPVDDAHLKRPEVL